MPLWDKLKTELDRAGRAAVGAMDEGKLRLEILRARQAADRAAERLGWALYKARKAGGELAADDYNRHAAELTSGESEIERLETLAREAAARRKGG
ncbi:MAG TPA: hypothetical protein VG818_06175 [Gemmatimonadaceae bacterium]|jgi:hypothetical protein|nr:hypothetical protein [Gemmatimonadaceae bacterium]